MKPETDQTNAGPIDPPRSEPDPKPGEVGTAPSHNPFARAMDGTYLPCDYPEDASLENGNYTSLCNCGKTFIGHKRRFICRECVTASPTVERLTEGLIPSIEAPSNQYQRGYRDGEDAVRRMLAETTAALDAAHSRIHDIEDHKDCVFCDSKRQTPGGDDPQCRLCALEANVPEAETCGWRPIKSAPKDGVTFLAFVPHSQTGFSFVATWSTDNRLLCMMSGDDFTGKPTHWQPLPPPPDGRRVEVKEGDG